METNSNQGRRRSRKEPAIRTTENRPGAGIRSNHSRHCVMAADSTVISAALRGCGGVCGGRTFRFRKGEIGQGSAASLGPRRVFAAPRLMVYVLCLLYRHTCTKPHKYQCLCTHAVHACTSRQFEEVRTFNSARDSLGLSYRYLVEGQLLSMTMPATTVRFRLRRCCSRSLAPIWSAPSRLTCHRAGRRLWMLSSALLSHKIS